jgi:single-strand DNA-binding protein
MQIGRYPRGKKNQRSQDELTGFETVKVNRSQRSNQGGQGAGGFGNQGPGSQPCQSSPQDDPWATPQTSSAGGWGNGPDSEPPF